MTSIIQSILAINPNAQVTVDEDDVKQIKWHNDTTPIKLKQIYLLNKQNYKQTMITKNIKENRVV